MEKRYEPPNDAAMHALGASAGSCGGDLKNPMAVCKRAMIALLLVILMNCLELVLGHWGVARRPLAGQFDQNAPVGRNGGFVDPNYAGAQL